MTDQSGYKEDIQGVIERLGEQEISYSRAGEACNDASTRLGAILTAFNHFNGLLQRHVQLHLDEVSPATRQALERSRETRVAFNTTFEREKQERVDLGLAGDIVTHAEKYAGDVAGHNNNTLEVHELVLSAMAAVGTNVLRLSTLANVANVGVNKIPNRLRGAREIVQNYSGEV